MIRSLLIFLPCMLLALVLNARTWTDHEGRTLEAEFVKLDDVNGVPTVFLKVSERYALAEIPLERFSAADQEWINNHTGRTKAKSAGSSTSGWEQSLVGRETKGKLVHLNGNKVTRYSPEEAKQADYVALYFSAHWCPPCRKFTPKLVAFYNEQSKKHHNFEIVFVSSDRSEEAMAEYMKEARMPWPALNYGSKSTSKAITKYAGSGIPCLVILDKNGEVLAHSYKNGKYVGPYAPMNELKRLLESGS